MRRYESLKGETRDLINCMLPGIASNFGVNDLLDVFPQDIRMRVWDCVRRDHMAEKSEDDPRNWGVQFLKELLSISRYKVCCLLYSYIFFFLLFSVSLQQVKDYKMVGL